MTDDRLIAPPPEDNPFFAQFGIRPHFGDEADAPPVDLGKLCRYYHGELGVDEREEVRDCIVTFRSWYVALARTATRAPNTDAESSS